MQINKAWLWAAGGIALIWIIDKIYYNIMLQKIQDAANNPNIKAFLDTIAYSEGTIHIGDNGYNVFFGRRYI
jgi:hypothetical protein